MVDYVSAVIGIFVVVVAAYWFTYGHRFEGPVSLHLFRSTHDLGSCDGAQKFDVIMGQQGAEEVTKMSSAMMESNVSKQEIV